MTTVVNPQRRRIDRIAEHIYTLPVVTEVPIRPPAMCFDSTW